MHNLSDEALYERWVENPYFQYFCGEVVFRHELPFDRSSLTRWRQRLGEEQIAAVVVAVTARIIETGFPIMNEGRKRQVLVVAMSGDL